MCLKKSDTYNIPESVQYIKENAFKGNTILTKVVFQSNSNLKEIGKSAFEDCSLLSNINIPISTINFLDKAFSKCRAIKTVFFGNKLEKIEANCFYLCTSLQSISFNPCDKNASINANAFQGCSSITSLTLAEGIYSIDMYCFADCTKLESVNLPSSLVYIGIYAFANTAVETVTFAASSSMTNISQYSFSGMKKLRDIQNIPSTIVEIGSNAFELTMISSFTVPMSTVNLSDSVFRGCSSMTVFTIPSDCALQNIGYFIFDGCLSLQRIECINSEYFVVDNGGLFNKERTSLICFPPASPINFFSFSQNVRSIAPSAFYSCKNLQGVLIPDNSISSIGHSAFAHCTSLKYTNIPLCVKTIESSVFIGCSNLRCGIIVQNTSVSFRQSLIESSFLSPTVLKDCALITCKNDFFKSLIPNSFLYVFIIM